MDDMKLAKWLNGTDNKGKDPGRVRYYYGTAVEDSADGIVKIRTDGTMITQDNQDYVELNCYGHISEGEVVRIASVNGIPAAEDSVGWGDKVHVDIELHGEEIDEINQTLVEVEGDLGEAAKVATNFIDFDEAGMTGLTIGNMTDTTLGQNVQIDSQSVNIREGYTAFATLAKNLIELGKTLKTAIIKLCNGVFQITANDKVYGGNTGSTGSITCTGGDDRAEMVMSSVNGFSQNYVKAHNSTDYIRAYSDHRTTYGSAAADMQSQYNDDGLNIQTTGSYIRSHGDVNLLSNANATSAGISSSYQLGQTGTEYRAVLNTSANSTNGGQISATFYDTAAATTKTVYLKPMYRLTNTHSSPNQFLYTTSLSEKNNLVNNYNWTLQDTYYVFA